MLNFNRVSVYIWLTYLWLTCIFETLWGLLQSMASTQVSKLFNFDDTPPKNEKWLIVIIVQKRNASGDGSRFHGKCLSRCHGYEVTRSGCRVCWLLRSRTSRCINFSHVGFFFNNKVWINRLVLDIGSFVYLFVCLFVRWCQGWFRQHFHQRSEATAR